MGTASAEGQGLCQACPSAAAGFVPHTNPQGWADSPGSRGMLCCRTREHRDVWDDALRAVKLLPALQDQPFITCSCLISCSLAADLLKGCFL